MQPTGPVDICNLALDRIGQQPISSILAPNSTNEDICARHYDQSRRKMLRKFIFNFARKAAVLPGNLTAPTRDDFANAYSLPPDFIRLLTLGDGIVDGGNLKPNQFDISGSYIYCDSASAFDPVTLLPTGLDMKYIYDAVTVPQFDPLFVDVLVLELAKSMAFKFTLKPSLVSGLEQQLLDANVAAAAVAGQERPPIRVQRSRIRQVRRSGGIFTDNTVIGGPGTGT